MTDFSTERRMMVDCQVRTRDVTDSRLTAAMLDIPRERFVPAAQAGIAYLDCDIPVGGKGGHRYLVQPMTLAKLLQAAEIDASHHVLDVGCATGYSTAIIARLAQSVVAVEEDQSLAEQAERNLRALAMANATVVQGPLNRGWPAQAPYDAIVLNGCAEVIPPDLLGQIKDGGCLVAILGRGPATKAMIYRSIHGKVSGWPIFDAAAPALPGFAKPAEFVF